MQSTKLWAPGEHNHNKILNTISSVINSCWKFNGNLKALLERSDEKKEWKKWKKKWKHQGIFRPRQIRYKKWIRAQHYRRVLANGFTEFWACAISSSFSVYIFIIFIGSVSSVRFGSSHVSTRKMWCKRIFHSWYFLKFILFFSLQSNLLRFLFVLPLIMFSSVAFSTSTKQCEIFDLPEEVSFSMISNLSMGNYYVLKSLQVLLFERKK